MQRSVYKCENNSQKCTIITEMRLNVKKSTEIKLNV